MGVRRSASKSLARDAPGSGADLLAGFPPIAAPAAHTLILGTMPGRASLAAGPYYAHPRNAFWRILGELLGFDPNEAYDRRTARLLASGIAVWDVLRACRRRGSLDSSIDSGSAVANDFPAFFAAHAQIDRIFCNGASAEALYHAHVLRGALVVPPIVPVRLPSTSPAHAALSVAAKTAAWRVIVRG
jgi:hypoxanthine-DNA glycosylase